ncbi:hypothetical protein Vafri_12509 [Volvox africanus]|uniref:Uncharacterized protein n=1 Tax=Volvox africanus TaxID=51714 RepID=A0A8J4F1N0_9CHLO|nr:hypothetical protein Vafri_12509 [Volvox africanus]
MVISHVNYGVHLPQLRSTGNCVQSLFNLMSSPGALWRSIGAIKFAKDQYKFMLGQARKGNPPSLHIHTEFAQACGLLQPCGRSSNQPHIAAAIFTGTYAVIISIALVLAPKQTFGELPRSFRLKDIQVRKSKQSTKLFHGLC